MFYDDVFDKILSDGVFSDDALLECKNNVTHKIRGIYYSGTYGEASETKYARAKAMVKDTFQVSERSLPAGVTKQTMMRQHLILKGKRFIIVTIAGADSGVLNLELKEDGSKA